MRNVMVFGLSVCVGVACLSRAGESKPAEESNSRKAAQEDLKKLQGTWKRISMEVEGNEVPTDALTSWTATYEDDRLTLSSKEGNYRQAIVTLDPSRKPKALNTWDADGPFADQTVPGIYEIDGDTMKVCFALPGKKRPEEFTTKRGTAFLYCVYERKMR